MLDMFFIHTGYFKEAMQLILKDTGLNSQAARDLEWYKLAYDEFISFQDIKDTDIVLKLIDATPLGEVR